MKTAGPVPSFNFYIGWLQMQFRVSTWLWSWLISSLSNIQSLLLPSTYSSLSQKFKRRWKCNVRILWIFSIFGRISLNTHRLQLSCSSSACTLSLLSPLSSLLLKFLPSEVKHQAPVSVGVTVWHMTVTTVIFKCYSLTHTDTTTSTTSRCLSESFFLIVERRVSNTDNQSAGVTSNFKLIWSKIAMNKPNNQCKTSISHSVTILVLFDIRYLDCFSAENIAIEISHWYLKALQNHDWNNHVLIGFRNERTIIIALPPTTGG